MLYVNALHDIVTIIPKKYSVPWFLWDFLFHRSQKRYKECIDIVHQFSENIIRDRLSEDAETLENNTDLPFSELHDSEVRRKNMDSLGLLMKKLRKDDLQNNVDALVFAGHDTTYAALSWAIQLLGEHTDVQEKVYEEMVQIFDGSNRSPTKQDLLEMKYLERVIKETLRLYPSGPTVGRKTRKDIQIGEYTIPAGASIWIEIYFIHRNPKYYPHPEEFNPDNFLPERVRDRHPYAYLPFSAGPRNCLGQRYAIMELKAVLSSIVRNFKIRSLKETKDLNPLMGLTITPHGGVNIELTLRDNNKENKFTEN
ncbi:cytochrome P450 4C1-like [Zootermopsis nevadensis]|uniref:Cytochrome P450 4C1 n=1 Tax=Zootermopsis nevadensis TaxID=136037 RepID=A0A067R3I7_ZOONE|nr:cytochrome P450 4C1-like [Zootermopsis nevadensis]KDR13646.1 Cytochrome P450 4C1 [Zootermopsis nevadensis]